MHANHLKDYRAPEHVQIFDVVREAAFAILAHVGIQEHPHGDLARSYASQRRVFQGRETEGSSVSIPECHSTGDLLRRARIDEGNGVGWVKRRGRGFTVKLGRGDPALQGPERGLPSQYPRTFMFNGVRIWGAGICAFLGQPSHPSSLFKEEYTVQSRSQEIDLEGAPMKVRK